LEKYLGDAVNGAVEGPHTEKLKQWEDAAAERAKQVDEKGGSQ
jgi:hypothetical protein